MAICGCSLISLRMSGPSTRHHAHRLDRLDGGRAQLVLEHGQLAEDVAGAERGQRDRAPVAVGAYRARVARRARRSRCRWRRPRETPPDRARSCAGRPARRSAPGRPARAWRTRAPARAAPQPPPERAAAIAQGIPHDGGAAAATGAIVRACSVHRRVTRRRCHLGRAVRHARAGRVVEPSAGGERTESERTAKEKPLSGRPLLDSHELWATIDVCSPHNQPHTVGVRGSMPGNGVAHDKMYMSFRLQYMDTTTKRWVDLVSEATPAFVRGRRRRGGAPGRPELPAGSRRKRRRRCAAWSTSSGAAAAPCWRRPRGRPRPGARASRAQTRRASARRPA